MSQRKFLCIISTLFVVLFLLNPLTIGVCANNITLEDDIVTYYDKEQEKILEKIETLGLLKAKAVSIKKSLNLDEHPEFKVDIYEKVLSEIEAIRSELVSLGAKPSKETLESIKFEHPVSVQGVLIDDFSGFEDTFDGAFDLWGISQTVNASYGTYYTYDIIIQDYAGFDLLATTIKQNGSLGYDIYASNSSSLLSLLSGKIGSIIFNKIAGTLTNAVPMIKGLYKGAQIMQSLKSVDSELDSELVVSTQGLGQSYRIFCSASPTIHFIFVRDSETGDWQHSFTTNTVAINEVHDWYMVFSVGNGQLDHNSGEKDYSTTLFPEHYTYRLTNAIKGYRNDKSLFYDVVDSYEVDVENSSQAGKTGYLFTLDISCPIDQIDLIRYGVH